jgi:protein-S-isoprenylcysteine O-methyltransferase Ste14
VGKGTLGVGPVLGEPVNLVVRGPYRHVRNPMISGVLRILLGPAPRPEISAHRCRTRSGHVIPTRAARKVAHVRP